MLQRYASRFDAVEINSSFYRPHRRETYLRWAAETPGRFRFAVKMPQRITHELALARAAPDLELFFEQVAGLGRKLGCVLVQLPGSFAFAAPLVRRFLGLVRALHDGPVAWEPRHRSWFTPAADALLSRHGVARVAADPACAPEAGEPGASDAIRYWRLHGSPRMYWSPYGPERIAALSARIASATAPTWVVFDNTAAGHAVADALALRALLGTRRVR